MDIRLRFLVIFMGGLLVLAVFTFPLWRPDPTVADVAPDFPELSAELQAAFDALPQSVQRIYKQMRGDNAPMAVDLLRARLQPPDPLPPEEQELPNVSDAVIAARGAFAAIELDEEDERDYQPYNDLYTGTSGTVTIYRYPDNRKLLRIENLNVVNGPNLRVLLSTVAEPLVNDDILKDRLRLDIGPLPAVQGNLNYASVPVEINIRNYRSLVIYDATYGVIFGVAQIG